jgi:FkbM family methyltransferase
MGAYRELTPILGIDETWRKIFIEPNPENYEYILNKMESIPNSKLIMKALCNDNEKHTLLTRSDMAGDSAATIMGAKFITDSIGSVNQAIPSYLSYEVEGITLKDILKDVTEDEIYIKMDIEGMEYLVLENFPLEYIHKVKSLYVEFHAHDNEMRERRDKIINDFANINVQILNWD